MQVSIDVVAQHVSLAAYEYRHDQSKNYLVAN